MSIKREARVSFEPCECVSRIECEGTGYFSILEGVKVAGNNHRPGLLENGYEYQQRDEQTGEDIYEYARLEDSDWYEKSGCAACFDPPTIEFFNNLFGKSQAARCEDCQRYYC